MQTTVTEDGILLFICSPRSHQGYKNHNRKLLARRAVLPARLTPDTHEDSLFRDQHLRWCLFLSIEESLPRAANGHRNKNGSK